MIKAIFVMDMPSTCGMCPMSGTDVCRKWNMKDLCEFPKDCPLREVPRKIDYASYFKEDQQSIDFSMGYTKGYNDCINKILGGEI